MKRLRIAGIVVCTVFISLVSILNAQTDVKLKAFLINVKGWTGGKPEGMAMSMGSMKMANAMREYRNKDKKIIVAVTITSSETTLGKIEKISKKDAPDNVKIVTKKVNGFTLKQVYAKERGKQNGTILIRLYGKDDAKGAVFMLNYENVPDKEALSIAKKFNWKGIKKLAADFLK